MSDPSENPSRPIGPLVVLIILFLLGAVTYVYQASMPGDFIYDDRPEINSNFGMGKFEHLWQVSTVGNTLPARPLPYFSFSLNKAVLGDSATGFLLVNVMIHAVNCLLLFRFLWLLANLQESRLPQYVRMLTVGGLVLIFAVHPLNVSAVSYIYQRMESLMAGFFLAASIQLIHYLKQPSYIRLILAMIFSVLSAFCKEVAVVLPFIPFMLAPLIYESRKIWIRRATVASIGMLATWMVVLASLITQRSNFASAALGVDNNAWKYLMTQSQVILFYLQSFVWPERLSLVYDWPLVSDFNSVMVPFTCLAAAIAVGIYGVSRGSLVGFGILWFFVVLSPTSSVLPLKWVAEDYRNYLAIVGLLVALTGLMVWIDRNMRKLGLPIQIVLLLGLVLWLTPLALMGRVRASKFQSRVAVWEDVVETQRAPITGANIASTVYLEIKDDVRAEMLAREAIKNYRLNPKPWGNLATSLIRQGRLADAEQVLEEGLQETRDDGSLSYAKASMLVSTDPQSAVKLLERATELDPNHEGAWNNLGILLARDASSYDRALECYKRSISLRFDNRSAYVNLAALFIKMGKLYDARDVLVRAQQIFVGDADVTARVATINKLLHEKQKENRSKNTVVNQPSAGDLKVSDNVSEPAKRSVDR